MTESKAREFFLTWSHIYVEGKLKEVIPRIFENPNADMLENNGVHVIEKSAYDKAVEALKGKTIRVRKTDEWGSIISIGHIIKDDWFNPEEELEIK